MELYLPDSSQIGFHIFHLRYLPDFRSRSTRCRPRVILNTVRNNNIKIIEFEKSIRLGPNSISIFIYLQTQ